MPGRFAVGEVERLKVPVLAVIVEPAGIVIVPAVCNAPVAVNVLLVAPEPNWAAPSTSRTVAGEAVPTPTLSLVPSTFNILALPFDSTRKLTAAEPSLKTASDDPQPGPAKKWLPAESDLKHWEAVTVEGEMAALVTA